MARSQRLLLNRGNLRHLRPKKLLLLTKMRMKNLMLVRLLRPPRDPRKMKVKRAKSQKDLLRVLIKRKLVRLQLPLRQPSPRREADPPRNSKRPKLRSSSDLRTAFLSSMRVLSLPSMLHHQDARPW